MQTTNADHEHIDPLKEVYHESFVENPAHREFLVEGQLRCCASTCSTSMPLRAMGFSRR